MIVAQEIYNVFLMKLIVKPRLFEVESYPSYKKVVKSFTLELRTTAAGFPKMKKCKYFQSLNFFLNLSKFLQFIDPSIFVRFPASIIWVICTGLLDVVVKKVGLETLNEESLFKISGKTRYGFWTFFDIVMKQMSKAWSGMKIYSSSPVLF